MSSDVFLGGISPYTPSEPAHKSVETKPAPAVDRPSSNERVEVTAAEVTKAPAPEAGAQPVKRRSFDELREMMRRVNMYIDPFEIQARFFVEESSGDVKVKIVNTVSGEVIRSIPPGEFERALSSPGGLRGLFTDRLA